MITKLQSIDPVRLSKEEGEMENRFCDWTGGRSWRWWDGGRVYGMIQLESGDIRGGCVEIKCSGNLLEFMRVIPVRTNFGGYGF